MRTLQRLAHVKPLAPGEAEQLHDERIRGARRDHRATWWRHARRVLVVLCAVGLLLGGKHWLLGRRIVVDGLVRATTHVALAESEGRVRWDVRAGQRVRRGDVLGRIDGAATGAGGPELQRAARLPLELAVDEAALQLELARNRPSAAHTEQLRLLDELVEARNEAEIARAQSEAARASLGELVESRTVLELSLRAGLVESERRADELIHMAGAARAAELEAEARTRTVEYEARTSSSLAARDLLPANEAELDRYRLETAERNRERIAAETQVFESTLAATGAALSIERERGAAELRRMDVAIEAARAAVDVADRRVALWSELAEVRARMNDRGGDPEALRRLELEVLEVRLAQAEASLAGFDARGEARCHDSLILAEFDAVIDRLLIPDGLPVDVGARLVTYHDPDSMWVEAYVPDTLVERVEGGRACRVMPTSSRSARKGRIRALGSSLVPLPDGLTSDLTSGSSWRLPIEVELDPEGTAEGPTLRPNLRVKVVVPRPAAREPAADAPR